MKIYITGDCHGSYNKFSTRNFPEQKELTKDDYVIVCEDFGIWNNDKEEQYWFKWLQDKPFTILFVDGNHENFDRLYSLSVSTWNSGKVHYINDSIIHLMRGQVFNIHNKLFFTMGGASSHDIRDGVLDPSEPDFEAKYKFMYKHNMLFRSLFPFPCIMNNYV